MEALKCGIGLTVSARPTQQASVAKPSASEVSSAASRSWTVGRRAASPLTARRVWDQELGRWSYQTCERRGRTTHRGAGAPLGSLAEIVSASPRLRARRKITIVNGKRPPSAQTAQAPTSIAPPTGPSALPRVPSTKHTTDTPAAAVAWRLAIRASRSRAAGLYSPIKPSASAQAFHSPTVNQNTNMSGTSSEVLRPRSAVLTKIGSDSDETLDGRCRAKE